MSVVRFADANSNRLLSPSIWKNFPRMEILTGDRDGVFLFDDFCQHAGSRTLLTTPFYGQYGPYTVFDDATGTVGKSTAEAKGVLALITDTTDNDEIVLGDASGLRAEDGAGAITTQDTGGNILQMTLPSSSSAYLTCFEARVKLSAVTAQDFFVGLMEEACVAADTVCGGTGTFTTHDYIGFRIDEADPDGIDFIWRKNGQAEIVTKNEAQVAVAATYYKLGFCFDPVNNTLRAFVDGVEVSETVLTSITAATFPSGDLLGRLIYSANRSGAARTVNMDWWAVGQVEA